MVADIRQPTTGYVHPTDPNLLNIHKAMEYVDALPHLRVSLGTDTLTINGEVNLIDNVRVNNSTTNPVPVFLTNELTTSTVYQGTLPWITNTTVTNWPALQLINGIVYAVQSGTWSVGVTGNVTVDNFTSTVFVSNTLTISNTSFAVTNFPTTSTVYQGTTPWTITGTVNIGTMPEVEIKNDTGNPVPISANTASNSLVNPIYVATSGNGSSMQITGYPDSAITAFDEPLAVAITPVIQAEAVYGLDPDFWIQNKLRGGDIVVTTDSTWQVSSGTSPGGYARLASSKYMSYQNGQGSLFRWTAAFTTTGGTTKNALGIDNIVQNTGPIDREDGYSFGYSGSTVNDASRKIGILHRRSGRTEIRKLTITVAPTGNQTATITVDGVAYTVAITAGDVNRTANQIAEALRANATLNNTWDIEGCNGIVSFTYYSPGAKGGTYSFSSSGAGTLAVGTFAQTQAGATASDVWTYVDSWDNQTIAFDPTKLNVFQIDMRWLGAGRVRFFMEDPATGKMVLVHTQRWASQYVVPHITNPALRVIYRSGTTNPAITPSQNVVVTGSSVFSGIQGTTTQTGSSQGRYNIDSSSRAKDTAWHLISLQNPYVRNNGVNKASLKIQTLTVAAQGQDPSVIYIVRNASGASDVISYIAVPNTTVSMFAQYSVSPVSINLDTQRIANVQTLGINSSAVFDLLAYNLTLAPGETIGVFISSGGALTRTAVGLTWLVD